MDIKLSLSEYHENFLGLISCLDLLNAFHIRNLMYVCCRLNVLELDFIIMFFVTKILYGWQLSIGVNKILQTHQIAGLVVVAKKSEKSY